MPELPDVMPNPDTFKAMKQKIKKGILRALHAAAVSVYYPDADITIQIRRGKCVRLDFHEVEFLKN